MAERVKMTTALMIGRFQPFHKGHLASVEYVLKKVEKVIIGIGSSEQHHTLTNPFTFEERKAMIEASLENLVDRERYIIVAIPDIHDDKRWPYHVYKLSPPFDVVYTNGKLEAHLFSMAGFEVRDIPFFNREVYEASEIRRRMVENENWRVLVPEGTAMVLERIGGVQRVKKLARLDKLKET